MGKNQKRNMFSSNPWNDTPYYDIFAEEWDKYGMSDTNSWWNIYERNKPCQNFNLIKHEMYKWVERI
jgi:hypothetical protein